MRIKFEIAADDTPTVVNSDFDAETIEVERDGDKLTVYVVVDFVKRTIMATYTSSQSGNFSATATWGGSGPPADGDKFVVASGHTVTIDSIFSADKRL